MEGDVQILKPDELYSKPRVKIDYVKLAQYYNLAQIGGAIAMDTVYNISLFKEAVGERGVMNGLDFEAYNSNGKTYVKRLTGQTMEERK